MRQRDSRARFSAPVLAALGQHEEALAAAEDTMAFGVPQEKLFYDPVWDSLRGDARFERLFVKLNSADDYKTARRMLGQPPGGMEKQ